MARWYTFACMGEVNDISLYMWRFWHTPGACGVQWQWMCKKPGMFDLPSGGPSIFGCHFAAIFPLHPHKFSLPKWNICTPPGPSHTTNCWRWAATQVRLKSTRRTKRRPCNIIRTRIQGWWQRQRNCSKRLGKPTWFFVILRSEQLTTMIWTTNPLGVPYVARELFASPWWFQKPRSKSSDLDRWSMSENWLKIVTVSGFYHGSMSRDLICRGPSSWHAQDDEGFTFSMAKELWQMSIVRKSWIHFKKSCVIWLGRVSKSLGFVRWRKPLLQNTMLKFMPLE